MLTNSLYVTTKDEKGHGHNYRLPVTETVPEGHEITGVRVAGTVRFRELLSPADQEKLFVATGR